MRNVHALWCGTKELPLQALLTIKSFQHYGYRFNLWTYKPVEAPVETIVQNANDIVPHELVYQSTLTFPGNYAYFADYFQAELLCKTGELWTHTDVILLKPFEFDDYFFAPHCLTGVAAYMMKTPRECPAIKEISNRLRQLMEKEGAAVREHSANMFIFGNVVKEYGLEKYIGDIKLWANDSGDIYKYFRTVEAKFSEEKIAHHWCHLLTKDEKVMPGTFFHLALIKYGIK